MIKRIELKDCTPYKQAELSDCKMINFIFGANGSGKSTISSFLKGDNPERFMNSKIEWNGSIHESIYVYNRDFRRSNFQQTIPGVFTMGSATIEDIEALNQIKKTYEATIKELEKNTEQVRKYDEDYIPNREKRFKDESWEQILKANVVVFQKAFEGFRNSKDRFVTELKRRIEKGQKCEGIVCEKDALINRAKSLYVSNPEKCEEIQFDVNDILIRIDEINKDPLWATAISGKDDIDIASLIKEFGNSSWVYQGMNYLEYKPGICPFCQQKTITEQFKKNLECFFDEEYNRRINRMKLLRSEYHAMVEKIVSTLMSALDMDSSIRIGKIDSELYSSKVQLFKSICDSQLKHMDGKIAEPGKRIALQDLTTTVHDVMEIINSANIAIKSHNKLVDGYLCEVKKLTDDVWTTLIHESNSLIKSYLTDISNLEKAANDAKKKQSKIWLDAEKLNAEIIERNKNITSVQPTIDEINRSLKAYGFTSFSIQPAEGQSNYYCIKRSDGSSAADTLSEGEETFLTFLYFMQWTKGSTDPTHISDKRILVLDDPISSLDSTILYIVGAMIKDLAIKMKNGETDVSQLFILTHNVFFHKEASFVGGKARSLKDVNFWIIRKNNDVSFITAYGTTNPISTSYELLWKELKENDDTSLISIQNIMRRIIENYFNIVGEKKIDDYLVKQFDSAEDQLIARSLLYWVNDGSHSIPDDLFIDQYSDAIPRYRSVFRALFVNSGHGAHYDMMMGESDDA